MDSRDYQAVLRKELTFYENRIVYYDNGISPKKLLKGIYNNMKKSIDNPQTSSVSLGNDFRFPISDFRFPISDFRFPISDFAEISSLSCPRCLYYRLFGYRKLTR